MPWRRNAWCGCQIRPTGIVLRHKRLVVLAWLVIAVAGFATISKATGALSYNFSIPGQAFKTDSTIQRLYHNGGFQNPQVVLTATVPPGTAAGPAALAGAGRLFAAAARAVPGSRLADQATTGDTRFSRAGGTASFALVFTPAGPGGSPAPDPAGPMRRVLSAAAPSGWQTGVSGLAQLEAGTSSGKGTSALTETLLGGLGALLVLAFVFASFIALLPLLMAAVAIPATFLLVYALTRVTSVNFIVQYLIALIGLGVAIDYSLLVVTRWRENRAAGLANEAAVSAAMATAGRAVVFSGTTVAISLLALVALPVAFLRGIGLAAFFIPLTTVAVAITLLPVLPHHHRPQSRPPAAAPGGPRQPPLDMVGPPGKQRDPLGDPQPDRRADHRRTGRRRGPPGPPDPRGLHRLRHHRQAAGGWHRAGRGPACRRAGHGGRGGHRQRRPARPRRAARGSSAWAARAPATPTSPEVPHRSRTGIQ
jgi:MMPL family